MNDTIKIVISDNHPLLLRGLAGLISETPGLELLGTAENGKDTLKLISSLSPDICILDVEMPGMSGIETAAAAVKKGIKTLFIFFTDQKDVSCFERAIESGAKAYILKDSTEKEVIESIHAVIKGEFYFSQQLSDILVSHLNKIVEEIENSTSLKLTPAEKKILRLTALDKSCKEIAAELYISPKTVENHRSNICKKLNLSGRHALYKFAMTGKYENE